MKKMLRAAAFLLALTLAPVSTAGAHDNGRRHRHGRKRTTVHVNHRNPTPGVARRVRRGRNLRPRVPRRRAINSNTAAATPRRNRAGAAHALEHGSGHGRMRPRVRVRN